jgi:hypothetical protein
MVYYGASTTHSYAIDPTQCCVIARGTINCDETGVIFGGRQWGNGESSDAVGYIENSTSRNDKEKGKT